MSQIVIKIIYDNCKAHENFQEGWGFSCLVDLGPRKILFDTGADVQAFFSNLQKFDIGCDEITDIIYSHKHADHIAGLEEVTSQLKEGSRLFLPKRFPSKKIPQAIKTEIVKDFKKIDEGVYSLVLKGGFFLYEQALLIETQQGVAVITGCAHPGIVRLLQEVKKRLKKPIHLVLGGFHLFKSQQNDIEDIIQQFKELQVQIAAPCHCSGEKAIQQFQEAFQESFRKIGTGTILTIDR